MRGLNGHIMQWCGFIFFGGEKGEFCMEKTKNIELLEVWGARELQRAGFSRSMAYQLLSRPDVPVIVIGNRRFVHAALFREWLRNQAQAGDK